MNEKLHDRPAGTYTTYITMRIFSVNMTRFIKSKSEKRTQTIFQCSNGISGDFLSKSDNVANTVEKKEKRGYLNNTTANTLCPSQRNNYSLRKS